MEAFRIETAVANLHAEAHLQEGVRHGAADDDAVRLVDDVVDQLDLIADLRAADDRQERLLRGDQDLAANPAAGFGTFFLPRDGLKMNSEKTKHFFFSRASDE